MNPASAEFPGLVKRRHGDTIDAAPLGGRSDGTGTVSVSVSLCHEDEALMPDAAPQMCQVRDQGTEIDLRPTQSVFHEREDSPSKARFNKLVRGR